MGRERAWPIDPFPVPTGAVSLGAGAAAPGERCSCGAIKTAGAVRCGGCARQAMNTGNKERIRIARSQGLTKQAIADELGLPLGMVTYVLGRWPVQTPVRPR